MNSFFDTWEWYIAGPLLGIFVPLLLIIGNKQFGISSSFEHMCYVMIPGSKKHFKEYSPGSNAWKLFFVIGIAIGGYLATTFFSSTDLTFLPETYYSTTGVIKLFIGGLLIGFGTRYANGCTAGHSIFGLSILNGGSLKATLAFFGGGLLFTFIVNFL
ncbi:MAG: YeeE/YedE family protein [Calditrichaeota bacterium]|nr:MAG: YeeE/YedE family protein [Calditrichota bacterium]MBL1205610.1 YeeE/YedE family protein [Calditrichota bacterium]NOG45438.1 YeeE/YedE family protein [Calditrichota bacterium]